MYVDLPDDQDIYHRWIICTKEIGNQFVKYNILPCDYWFHFIVKKNGKRYKRKIWGVTRTQSSYNSGSSIMVLPFRNKGKPSFELLEIPKDN